MKDALAKVRSVDKMCVDIMCIIMVLIGMIAILIKQFFREITPFVGLSLRLHL